MDRNNLKQVKLVFESFEDTGVEVFFTEDSYLAHTPDDIILLKANEEKTTIYDRDSIYRFTFTGAAFIISAKIEGKILNCYRLFSGCCSLTNLDVTNLDTSEAFDMDRMFYECCGLTSLDVSNFDTSNVTSMESMFYACTRLSTLDVSNFDTSNVEYMGTMFCGCTGLTSLDVSNFDTSNVTDMGFMFCDCYKLTTLDLSKWDISNVINMNLMFNHCRSLTTIGSVDIASGWQHRELFYKVSMFEDCPATPNLFGIINKHLTTSNYSILIIIYLYCFDVTRC